MHSVQTLVFVLLGAMPSQVMLTYGFQSHCNAIQHRAQYRSTVSSTSRLVASNNEQSSSDGTGGGGYDETGGTSKGLVSALTNLINQFAPSSSPNSVSAALGPPPTSPAEVMERIQADYVDRNCLWTGDLDMASFTPDCICQDPTIRFEGRDTFVTNVQNIRKISDALLGPCRSELINISLQEDNSYVETRWRMVGLLQGLPWKPCIDVPGRTKFWLTQDAEEAGAWQVCRYEEEWDIPAAQALWQLVKPTSGTYPEEQSTL